MRRADLLRRAGLFVALGVVAAMPVGAGASGHSALAMLAFAGLFLLANAVLRPGAAGAGGRGGVALQALTAAAFAALLVGLGQTLRALAQIEGDVDLLAWVVTGAWAVVLARIVWPRTGAGAAGAAAERALREVHRRGERARRAAPPPPPARAAPERRPTAPARAPAPPRSAPGRTPAAAAPGDASPGGARAPDPEPAPVPDSKPDTMPEDPGRPAPPPRAEPAGAAALAPLDALPDTADAAAIRAALAEVAEAAPAERVFAALAMRAEGGGRRDRLALLLHATDPALGARRPGAREPEAAFEAIVAAADTDALAAFLAACEALVEAEPAARDDLPPVARLIEIADQIEATHEGEAEGLISLARQLEDLAEDAESRDA